MAGPDPARSFLGRVPGADDLGHHRAPGHLRPHRGRGRRLDRRRHARRGCGPASAPRPGWPGSAPPAGCTSPGSCSPPCATPRRGRRGRGTRRPPRMSPPPPRCPSWSPPSTPTSPRRWPAIPPSPASWPTSSSPAACTSPPGPRPSGPSRSRPTCGAASAPPGASSRVSLYAATESPVIASGTPKHPELEIAEDVVLVEVVDEAQPRRAAGHARRQGPDHQPGQLRPAAHPLRAHRRRHPGRGPTRLVAPPPERRHRGPRRRGPPPAGPRRGDDGGPSLRPYREGGRAPSRRWASAKFLYNGHVSRRASRWLPTPRPGPSTACAAPSSGR